MSSSYSSSERRHRWVGRSPETRRLPRHLPAHALKLRPPLTCRAQVKLGILTLKNKKSAKDKDPIKSWVYKGGTKSDVMKRAEFKVAAASTDAIAWRELQSLSHPCTHRTVARGQDAPGTTTHPSNPPAPCPPKREAARLRNAPLDSPLIRADEYEEHRALVGRR